MISERLKFIASLIPPAKTLADVGCDHGLLIIEAFEKYGLEYAVAIDNKEQPLKSAHENIKKHPFFPKVRFSLSDGLADLKEGEAEAIVIAGIGGILMTEILKKGLERHRKAKFILQANRNLFELRKFLYDARMEIASERIIFEDGQYYEIIVSRAARKPLNYTEEDLIFGPVLRRERHPLFIRKLEEELKRYQEIGYENVREKIERIKEQLYENQNDR